MSFSFALPAASAAITGGKPGAADADPSGEAMGLFGQLLAMLGIDAGGEAQLDAKTLAQTLGKAAATKTEAGQDTDSSKDETTTDSAVPVDLSALIAALLAAALPTTPASQTDAAQADDGADQVTAGGPRSAGPLEAQLETLLSALTGLPAPDGNQAATDLAPPAPPAKLEVALAPQNTASPAQAAPALPVVTSAPAQTPLPADAGETPPSPEAPRAAEAPAQPAILAAATSIQTPAAAQKPGARQIAVKPASAPTPAGKAAASEPAQEPLAPEAKAEASATPEPTADRPLDPALLVETDLVAKTDKPDEDEAAPTLAANTPAPAAADGANPLATQDAVRGSPETVAKLAAQIIKKLDAKTTRFEVALDPIGLGRVDVKVEIGANGKLHAQMSFDSAAAASDLRGRAGQLREALEQAGFDLRGGSLNFDVAGQGGQGRGQQQQHQQDGQPRFAGAAGLFEAALNLGDAPLNAPVWTKAGVASGVDIRI